MRHDVVLVAELGDGLEHLVAHLADQLAQPCDALGGLPHAEDLRAPRRAVDPVHDVVEVGREEVDVLPVDGRDERPVEPRKLREPSASFSSRLI
jgi:hypothetical protein